MPWEARKWPGPSSHRANLQAWQGNDVPGSTCSTGDWGQSGQPPPSKGHRLWRPKAGFLEGLFAPPVENDPAGHGFGCKASDTAFFLERADSSAESLSPPAGRGKLNLKIS